MKVKITSRNEHEWSAVCSQFGVNYEPIREVTELGVDGDQSYTIRHYYVDDEHMATWIKLIKPLWIDREQSA